MQTRPLTLQDTVELTDLKNRHGRFWGVPAVSTQAELEDELTEPFVELERDTIGAWLDGDLVGYGLVWHRPSGVREERAYLQGLVDPAHRGRGIGRSILGWSMERARESLAGCPASIPWYIRAHELDWIEDTHRLYRRFGLEPVRYTREMIRRLDQPVAPDPVPHVEIVRWDRRFDDGALRTLNAAFEDHWGSTPLDVESFRHRLESAWSRLDLSFLAVAGDEVVGVCYNAAFPEDEAATGRHEGWVMNLGVSREWRSRGVATALLKHSFNAFLAAGMTHTMLAVDAANPTGAFRLYESLGYETIYSGTTSQIQVNRLEA